MPGWIRLHHRLPKVEIIIIIIYISYSTQLKAEVGLRELALVN